MKLRVPMAPAVQGSVGRYEAELMGAPGELRVWDHYP